MYNFLASLWVLAADAGSTTEGAGSGSSGGGGMLGGMLIPLIIIFGIMYLFIFAPQRKKDKLRRQMLDAIQKGDDVVTIGGIHGKVWQVKEDAIVVQVADDMKLTFSRGAVATVKKEGGKSELLKT